MPLADGDKLYQGLGRTLCDIHTRGHRDGLGGHRSRPERHPGSGPIAPATSLALCARAAIGATCSNVIDEAVSRRNSWKSDVPRGRDSYYDFPVHFE
jgi:hypothetical protein